MDQVTQQNAALVEEAAAAATSMQDQAAKLAEVVSVFKLDRAHDLSVPTRAKVAAPAAPAAKVARPALPRAAAPKVAAKPTKRSEPVAAGDWEEF
jgi:methyl-accepting chemotaxis protein